MPRPAGRLLATALLLACAGCSDGGPVARATTGPSALPRASAGAAVVPTTPQAACDRLPRAVVDRLVPGAEADPEQAASFEDSVSAVCGWTSTPDAAAGAVEVSVTRYAALDGDTGADLAAETYDALAESVCTGPLPEVVGERSCALRGEGRSPGLSVVAYALQDDLVVMVRTARRAGGTEDQLVAPVTALLQAAVRP